MQYTFATLALAATAAAHGFVRPINVTEENVPRGFAKVVNRCSYPVHIWSIDKELGCQAEAATTLETGDSYTEKFRLGTNGGISIKIAKTNTCGGKDITQLEYYISQQGKFQGNYLDMSFVDCTGTHDDCPGRLDGYYLQSGDQISEGQISSENNEHCPVFGINADHEVAAVAYILPNDRQTKFCKKEANLDLYLCGGHAPGEDATEIPEVTEPKSSSKVEETPKSTPTPEVKEEPKPEPTPVEEPVVVAAAAAEVTPAPKKAPVIKTEVVYVTKFVKRHGHARRHHH